MVPSNSSEGSFSYQRLQENDILHVLSKKFSFIFQLATLPFPVMVRCAIIKIFIDYSWWPNPSFKQGKLVIGYRDLNKVEGKCYTRNVRETLFINAACEVFQNFRTTGKSAVTRVTTTFIVIFSQSGNSWVRAALIG